MNVRIYRRLLLSLNITTLFVFIATAILNGLASRSNLGIFVSSIGAVSDKYYVEITPAGWTFSIWGIIYTWQALWIVYALTLFFRKGSQGPLYLNPKLLSPVFFCIYIVNLLLNIGWLFLFDREMLELSFVFLFFITITLYMCLWTSYRSLERNRTILVVENRKLDNILMRAFVHNGLGVYAAWTSIATCLNIGFAIAYRYIPRIPQDIASTVALAFIAILLVAFIATDLTVFDKYARFTVTPYAVVIWALSGSMAKNFEVLKTNSAFSVVLLGLAVGGLIVKVFIIIRLGSKPIFSSSVDIAYQEKTSKEDDQGKASDISTPGSSSDILSETGAPNVTQESLLDASSRESKSGGTTPEYALGKDPQDSEPDAFDESKAYHITNGTKTPDICTPETASQDKASDSFKHRRASEILKQRRESEIFKQRRESDIIKQREAAEKLKQRCLSESPRTPRKQ